MENKIIHYATATLNVLCGKNMFSGEVETQHSTTGISEVTCPVCRKLLIEAWEKRHGKVDQTKPKNVP